MLFNGGYTAYTKIDRCDFANVKVRRLNSENWQHGKTAPERD
jgi:hypothetical protein